MKIVLPTIGSRGDVQPYIALACALQKEGFEVAVATHPCMRSLVEFFEVPFTPIGSDIDIGVEAAAIRDRSFHFMIGMIRVMKFSFAMLEEIHEDLLELCREADLLIVSHTAAGSIEADKLNLPRVSVTLHPQAIPVLGSSDPLTKRIAGSLAGWGMSFFMSRPLNKIRRRLDLAPMGKEGMTSPLLNLIPVSTHVIEPDQRWEERHKMTGYWFSDPPLGWTPPEELSFFLKNGDPPVVISLGAMALDGRDMKETADLTVKALQKLELRAVIQGWDSVAAELKLPGQIIHVGSIPHTYLLPKASCLVHHGGFGSTAAAFQAGIPAVVVPHIIDQFIWGSKVFELGVGPKPIPRAKLTADSLALTLDQAVNNRKLRENAKKLGNLIRAENGLENAVNMIKDVL